MDIECVFLVVRECGLAHKTIIFVLDEFDLFAQVRVIILLTFPATFFIFAENSSLFVVTEGPVF